MITNVKLSTTAVIHLYNVDEELSQYSKMKCNFKAFLKALLDLILRILFGIEFHNLGL